MLREIFNAFSNDSVIKIVEFSEFVDISGPTPKYCYPNSVNETFQTNIAMKSISLLMGESAYQSGFEFDNLKYFGILPFPDIDMVGLTYFFLIRDLNSRGKAKAATITILVEEKDNQFLYENIKTLRLLLNKTSEKFEGGMNEDEIAEIMDVLKEELINFDPTSNAYRHITRKIKIVFSGLDNSGKSSFLKNIKQKYSELIGITPTKGIDRSEQELLGAKLLEWDFGGQSNYRINYFKNAEIFLSDIDILFYIIDIQDDKRIEENHSYLNQILTTLESFKSYPLIFIIFHKVDQDIAQNKKIRNRIYEIKNFLKDTHSKWPLKFFETTIFDHWSIISAFSYAISQLSPNRELFRNALKWLVNQSGGNAAILLSNNSIILSDYSKDWYLGKFIEYSQSDFYNLYAKFEEFDLINTDSVSWEFKNINILLKKFILKEKIFYILLQSNSKNRLNLLEIKLEEFKEKILPLLEDYF